MAAPRLDKLDKNYIINGNFDFWQRGILNAFGGTGSAAGYFSSADRVRFSASTTNDRSNRQVQRSTDVPTLIESGFRSTYSLQYSQTSALVLASATDHIVFFQHRVEGLLYRNLHGKTMTLSFWFKSTLAGQYPVAFRNGALNRSYVTLFTYDTANVWQKIKITVETDVGGTWLFDTGIGLDIIIGAQSGATYQAPSMNTWLSGEYFALATGVQVQSQTSITINIAQLQLVEGDLETEAFSPAGRNNAEELILCQRYFEKSYEFNTAPGAATASGTAGSRAITGAPYEHCSFAVWKRVAPIITLYDWAGAVNRIRTNGVNNVILNGSVDNQVGSFMVIHNTSVSEIFFHWTADAEL